MEKNYNDNLNYDFKLNNTPSQNKKIKKKIINKFKQYCEGLNLTLVDYNCSRDGSKIIQQQLNFHKIIKIKLLIKNICTN